MPQLIINAAPEVLEAIEAFIEHDSDALSAIMSDTFYRTEDECAKVHDIAVEKVNIPHEELYAALDALRVASKESTENMRRVYYSPIVQDIFKKIEGDTY